MSADSVQKAANSAIEAMREMIELLEQHPHRLISMQQHLDPYGPGVRQQTVKVTIVAPKQTEAS